LEGGEDFSSHDSDDFGEGEFGVFPGLVEGNEALGEDSGNVFNVLFLEFNDGDLRHVR
jgi:hypothetical protein